MRAEERLPVIPKSKPKTPSRANKKLLAFLFLFFITLLCVLFFQSSFSKISSIEIQGQELLTAETIGQAAAVKPGDHFFSVSSSTIENQVQTLPMIESAEVTKHFPGVIRVKVKEFPKVAYQFGENNQPEAILADGSVMAVTEQMNFILDKPILSGWSGSENLKAELCKTLGSIPSVQFSDVSEIKPDPSESYPDRIKLYTRSQFEVITTIGYLPDKLKYLDSYIANLKEKKINTGVLTLLEADTHAPFAVEQPQTTDADSGSQETAVQDDNTYQQPKGASAGSSDQHSSEETTRETTKPPAADENAASTDAHQGD
ncbi:cell division protein FtsQ/DivIB [Paenibacillus xerothermodurans]|uniref:Cell division protein DivIB n=1 Tax=Paenibacillus xerothermodurans TaxID=1977292 RepID=A0A2W1P6F9_PAEXE|nr:FtsQ-type POTRA domain-containing protein [Paenibacillus xerothermodurans]PZE22648.1 cell division protein FtsQ [Paenibacillus xerothermodurans]